MASIGSLYNASSALTAQRRALEAASHNVANASTPGYHRQRVELSAAGGDPVAAVFAGRRAVGGVDVTGVTRVRDELLAGRAAREDASSAQADRMQATMSRIEGLFPEPSDTGLASQLAAFWEGWTELADNPGNEAGRGQLLEQATTLVNSLHHTRSELQATSDGAVERLKVVASRVNQLAGEVSAMNGAIGANPGGAANDLLDERDQLVAELARLVGGEVRPLDDGQVSVMVGGRALVAGTAVSPLEVAGDTLRWVVGGNPATPTSGEAAALVATINDVVPRYIAGLDDVAARLVADVNTLHTAGVGGDGGTGRNFFDPAGTTAATIAVSADVAGQPTRLAAAAPGTGPLDGQQARAIAALATATAGADAGYSSLVSSLGVEVAASVRRADVQGQVAAAAQRDADSVGAVSLDEEMTNLVTAQHAYEAAARVVTAVDEMLSTVIQRLGLGGR